MGSSEHSAQERELIMSMLLTLTLPKSMNIQSLEPSDGFIKPNTLALHVCDALQALGLPPRCGI